MKKLYIILSLVLTALLLCACSKTADDGGVSSLSSGEAVKTDINTDQMDFKFTNNDLNYGYDESSANTVGENEDIIKITAEGTYVITGGHTQIVVSAPDTAKIKIVLKNAAIENSTGPAIYITDADKVFITAYEGTENTVSDGAEYSSEYSDSNVDAAIFSRADLTLNGRGSLSVTGNMKCGIASKDDLVICGLKLTVTSAGRGIEGKDCVKCSDAAVTVNAGGDGVDSNGSVNMSGGVLLVSGPTNNGNGAFDYNSSAVITGGTAILCGSSGMEQGFSENSTQASFIYTLDSSMGVGSSIAVSNSQGVVIASFIPSKQYSNIVVSSPELTVGSSYTVTLGGTVSDCDENGYAKSGKVSGGEKSFSVEISTVSTSYGSAGGMGGGMERNPGGDMGGKPDRANGGGKAFGIQG